MFPIAMNSPDINANYQLKTITINKLPKRSGGY